MEKTFDIITAKSGRSSAKLKNRAAQKEQTLLSKLARIRQLSVAACLIVSLSFRIRRAFLARDEGVPNKDDDGKNKRQVSGG
jgi:hypothetical protein